MFHDKFNQKRIINKDFKILIWVEGYIYQYISEAYSNRHAYLEILRKLSEIMEIIN